MANKIVVEKDKDVEKTDQVQPVHPICEYKLKFKSKGITQYLQFKHHGDRTSAIERARLYCQNMRLLFIYVDDIFTDLDLSEERMIQRDNG